MDKHWDVFHDVLNSSLQIISIDPTMPMQGKINSSAK